MSHRKKGRPAAHPADAWAAAKLAEFPDAKKTMKIFYKGRADFGESWPPWCDLPMAAVLAYLTHGSDNELLRAAIIDELPRLTAALIWSKTKTVYRFDHTVMDALHDQPLDDALPIDALFHLPYPCVFVETPEVVDRIGYFAWMEMDANSLVPELRLLHLTTGGETISNPVILSGGTIDDSITALERSNAERQSQFLPTATAITPEQRAEIKRSLARDINLLLYLCSDQPDLHRQQQPGSPRPAQPKGERTTEIWEVGVRVGNAIRRYQNEATGDEIETEEVGTGGTHKPPRPHLRRAHWHHFWTGPLTGQRSLTVRWLPPIPVGYDPDAEQPTVIHRVK